MKKFLYRILLFTLLVLVCAFGLDTIISSRLRFNKNRIYASWNHIYNDTTNYDVIISGNSRAQMHINPLILDSILHINSYNFGLQGRTINTQIIKYQKYRELHEAPKILIQAVDLWTLEFNNGYEREQFFPYFFYDRDLIRKMDEYEKFSFLEEYIPCYRYLGYEDVISEAIFYGNKKYFVDFTSKGYSETNLKWDGTALSTIDSVQCSCDTNAIKIFVNYLSKVVTIDDTKVLFVYTPIYREVRERMTDEENMFKIYDTIAKRFNIPILDYNDIPMCYDTTYFYNGTHLNRTGAELFTTKLAHDIDSLGLLK